MGLFILVMWLFGIPRVLCPFISLFTLLFISVSGDAKTNNTVHTLKELIISGRDGHKHTLLVNLAKEVVSINTSHMLDIISH